MTFDESLDLWLNSDEYKRQKERNDALPPLTEEQIISCLGPDYEYWDEIAKEAQENREKYGQESLKWTPRY